MRCSANLIDLLMVSNTAPKQVKVSIVHFHKIATISMTEILVAYIPELRKFKRLQAIHYCQGVFPPLKSISFSVTESEAVLFRNFVEAVECIPLSFPCSCVKVQFRSCCIIWKRILSTVFKASVA